MIPSLRHSEKYLKDVERFKVGIEKITNEQSKQKGYQLLKQLEEKVKLIDKMHSGVANLKSTKEEIANTVKLRHQLNQLIK